MRLEDLASKALRSERWHRKTAARASALASAFHALDIDLAGRSAERAKDGPGKWMVTALDNGVRVLVALVTAPVPRRWSDDAPVTVEVRRADLLVHGAIKRLHDLGEAEPHVDAPTAEPGAASMPCGGPTVPLSKFEQVL